MTRQDYINELKSDIKDYITEHGLKDRDSLYDELWIADSVTGNGSGSYTFSTYQAKENVKDIIWEDETLDMFREFGEDHIPLEKGAEHIDVSIRCFLLGEALDEVLDELDEVLDEMEE